MLTTAVFRLLPQFYHDTNTGDAAGLWSRKSHHPTTTPTTDRLRPSAVSVT